MAQYKQDQEIICLSLSFTTIHMFPENKVQLGPPERVWLRLSI